MELISISALLLPFFIYTLLSSLYSKYGIYSTRILNGPACTIRRRNHQIKEIQLIGGDPRLKFLFSPGFELEDAER